MDHTPISNDRNFVFWHRELPPLEAELVAEHTVEVTSARVAGTISHRDELWDRCYDELAANVHDRLAREIARLGGDFAHVHGESIDIRHDEAAGLPPMRRALPGSVDHVSEPSSTTPQNRER